MNKSDKYEIKKMLSLMERMDKHLTLRESEFEKELLKEDIGIGRTTLNSLDELINTYDIGRSFVGLAYIQGYEASKVYPGNTEYSNSVRSEIGKLDSNSRISGKFNNFINSTEFTNPTGRAYNGLKSMKTSPFSGIIKITNYVFNWGSSHNLADFYDKYRLKMADKRRELGFGNDENSYSEDDWRRNPDFKGLGANPASTDKRKNPDGSDVVSSYHDKINPKMSLYGDTDSYGNTKMSTRPDGTQYQKRAFRFGLSDITKQWADYCIVDNNGEIDDIEKSLAKLFYKVSIPKDLTKAITSQMSADEINARREIMKIENEKANADKTWLEDNIAYIIGTGVNLKTGQKEPFRWINKNIYLDKVNVNQDEFQNIINKEVEFATREVLK